MKKYNIQLESVRATLTGKIKGFKIGVENIEKNENTSTQAKNRSIHTIEFAIRELEDVLKTLEYFDEKDEEA
jgi:ribulose bisphosphate carboxylase small subunit